MLSTIAVQYLIVLMWDANASKAIWPKKCKNCG